MVLNLLGSKYNNYTEYVIVYVGITGIDTLSHCFWGFPLIPMGEVSGFIVHRNILP